MICIHTVLTCMRALYNCVILSYFHLQVYFTELKEKMEGDYRYLFPEGLNKRDNQTDSGTCTRHAIAKCISNYMYKQMHIDVEQFEITRQLVQEKKYICGIWPSDYNDMKLILQDVDNLIEGYSPRSWWEVMH